MSQHISNFEKRCEGGQWKSMYAMLDYKSQEHHVRYRQFIASMERKLVCQACGGAGGEVEHVDEHGGPFMHCGWCEGTGYVSPHIRGVWLRNQKEVAR